MIKSMTGFAVASQEHPLATVTASARSVNHRYLDVQLRLPSILAVAEPALRALVQQRIGRGRVEVAVAVQARRMPQVTVELNESFVTALHEALDGLRDRGLVSGTLTAGDLLRHGAAMTVREVPVGADPTEQTALQQVVEAAVSAAVVELDEMRTREGALLGADLDQRRRTVLATVDRIEAAADESRQAAEARLARRVAELALDVRVEPGVLAQEIVRAAGRADISEELVRLRAHLAHWTHLSAGAEACGRKLDFLLQEMHREINTIGAKAESGAIAESVVHLKAELEKMREQVQNIE